jgi:hypothetical protein
MRLSACLDSLFSYLSILYAYSEPRRVLINTGVQQSAREAMNGAYHSSVAKQDRGFASMDRDTRRHIASKGGKAAHEKGAAHEWTAEEARRSGDRF